MSMEVYKRSYDERKENVLSLLDQTSEFLRQQEQEEKAQPLEKLRKNVEEDLFSIVLVGEFSAGKSTFLNALMHRRILPSFTSETTATVNFLRHEDQAPNHEAGIVYYLDGRTETLDELSLDAVAQVVSTRGDRGEEKIASTVARVDLFLDSDLLRDGVMLVDSPGLNGVADHHREITESQIRASHASIFMFSADHPGSKTDFEYLRQLKSQSNNIFFVLNKINVIRDSEHQTVESVVEELRTSYHRQFPDETQLPKIWPVASDAALAARDASVDYHGEAVETQERRDQLEEFSRFGDFENRLWQYLTQGEKAQAQLCGPVESCIAALTEQHDYLGAQKTLMEKQTSWEELEKQRDFLQEKIMELEQERKKTAPELSKGVTAALRELTDMASANAAKLTEKIRWEIENIEDSEELQAYAERLTAKVDSQYRKIAADMDEELRERLVEAVQESYADYFIELEDRFLEISDQVVLPFKAEKLSLDGYTVSVGLAQFEETKEKLELEIQKKEEELERLEQNSIEARIMTRKLAEYKEELESAKTRKDMFRQTFVIPDPVKQAREEPVYQKRSGFLGVIGNFFFGPKYRGTITKYDDDTTAHDAAIRERDQAMGELDQEIVAARVAYENAKRPDMAPELVALRVEQTRKVLERLEQKRSEENRKFMDTLDKQAEKMRRKFAKEVLDAMDDYAAEFSRAIKKYLKEQKSAYINAAQDLLNANLDQELQQANGKLGTLLQTIESDGAERQQRLELLQEALDRLKELLGQASDLSVRLKSEMDDHIEQEAFSC